MRTLSIEIKQPLGPLLLGLLWYTVVASLGEPLRRPSTATLAAAED